MAHLVGKPSGLALDAYAFELTLGGSFNPETGKLSASILEGGVNILDVVTVHFEGTLMSGTRDGYSTGTTPEEIPGTAAAAGRGRRIRVESVKLRNSGRSIRFLPASTSFSISTTAAPEPDLPDVSPGEAFVWTGPATGWKVLSVGEAAVAPCNP